MESLTVCGVHTHRVRLSHGARPALALHCSLASARAFGPLSTRLDGVFDLVGMDLPGHGKSGDWDGTQDLQDLSTDMAEACLPDEPVHLIGHSFGATVALRLAVRTPDRVRSLTLIEPVFFAAAFADSPDWRARHEAEMAPFAEAMARGDRDRAAQFFMRIWGDGRPWDALPEAQRASCAARIHLIGAANHALCDDPTGMLAPGSLSGLTMPGLLLEGSASPRIISHINAALSRRMPNVRRAVIAGAGHMLPITHPTQVACEIGALLADMAPVG